MKVELKDISKRYTESWILKKINFSFQSGKAFGIKGLNGSGKSTLMQIISGQLSPTFGEVIYSDKDGQNVSRSDIFQRLAFSAPYILPIEDLSLEEVYDFHGQFRAYKDNLNKEAFIDLLDYPFKKHQYVKYYSSGMKQRLSLALSILTDSDLLLLDEPTSYLDIQGKQWFHSLLDRYRGDSTLIISTNDDDDLESCTDFLELSGY